MKKWILGIGLLGVAYKISQSKEEAPNLNEGNVADLDVNVTPILPVKDKVVLSNPDVMYR